MTLKEQNKQLLERIAKLEAKLEVYEKLLFNGQKSFPKSKK
jgi:BMFP domain-containing protein YqiC